MPRRRSLGLLLLLAAGAAAAGAGPIRSALVYYTGPVGPGPEVNALVAERYELGVTGLEIGRNALEIRGRNPEFAWFVYNSATDNYRDSEESALAETIAARHGWDPEIAYYHYWDDTRLTLQGRSVFVPGWGGGSARRPAEARVPVYYADLSRQAVSFATAAARQLQEELVLGLTIDRTFAGTTLRPDGIFLDNAAYQLYNTGDLIEGGHVREAPGHARVESDEFQRWHWEQGFGPFLSGLEDTLAASASWAPDRRRKRLMINVANAWSDSYVSRRVADILFLEFQYDPVRNADAGAIPEARQRDSLAAAAGIRSLYAPAMKQSAPPCPGKISYGDALLGSLAWHLVTRSDSSLLFLYGTGDPAAAGWDSLTWRRCVEVANRQLGSARGEPYVIAEGTDPLRQPYRVWARAYENGLALVRNRGRWDEGIAPATAVTVPLPAPLAPISPAGTIGGAVSSISLRNGAGAVLLGDPD